MKQSNELGSLLVEFVNRVSHPRGRALTFLTESGVTVDQAILLNYAKQQPGSTPSALASTMNLSPPSVSQMLDRLHRLGMVERTENASDRRQKAIHVTAKATMFLKKFHEVRCEEFLVGTVRLSAATRRALTAAIKAALGELEAAGDQYSKQESEESAQ